LEPDRYKQPAAPLVLPPLLFVRFLSVAGDRFPHRRQEKEEERRLLQPPCFPVVFAAARGFTRRQGRWRVEETRRHCSSAPETFQPLFLQIPKGVPAVSCYFLGVGSVILEC
jgi:hypothetical protein